MSVPQLLHQPTQHRQAFPQQLSIPGQRVPEEGQILVDVVVLGTDRHRHGVALKPHPVDELSLIHILADQAGVSMDRGELMREAVKWDMKFPGRTPRGARQFIASLSAR